MPEELRQRQSRPLNYANVMATLAVFAAIGGGAVALGGVVSEDGEIRGCFDKKGRGQGELRLLVKGKCTKGERRIAWNQEGPRGPAGAAGASGSPDTPQQVLDKLALVDGAGSGLDADLLDGVSAADFARDADVFTKAQSDARFLRSSPREVVVRADGTPAQNGQALRAALAGLPAASQTDPIAVQLTAGAYAPGAGPLAVPSFVTLRGAGRRATVIDGLEPVVLEDQSTLEDLVVFGTSGVGPAAVEVTGDGALVERVEVFRLGEGVAEALRVSGGEVTVRDSSLTAAGNGGSTNVRAVNAGGGTHLIDTDIAAFSGFGELRGVLVENGFLDMVGGTIVLDDNDTPGFTPVGLHLGGGISTVRDTVIRVLNSQSVRGVQVETAGSSLSGVSVRASSGSGIDTALEADADVTVETSELVANGTGDVGIQTSGATTEVQVATSRIAAPITATGNGTESCVFSYGAAFTALSAACL